jgi:hypothetical protein
MAEPTINGFLSVKYQEHNEGFFPEWDNPNHPDSVIDQCLRWYPVKRTGSFAYVIRDLQRILQNL